MGKPMIGILPLVDVERESYWMLPGYMEGVSLAGGLPVMLPLTDDEEDLNQLSKRMDGFLFTGGQDVSPAVYHEQASAQCGECCPARDTMESALFRLLFEVDKPIFGICRGIQFINAIMGGTLYQDLPTERPTGVMHHQSPPYDIPAHTVKIMNDTPLYDLLGKDSISVNSYHHQAIRELAPGLSAMAISEDGLIEAVFAPGRRFLWAVQWHPEFSYLTDENSRKLFTAFVDNCRK